MSRASKWTSISGNFRYTCTFLRNLGAEFSKVELSKQDSDENLFLHLMIKYRNMEVSSENVCTSTFTLILSLIRYGNLYWTTLRSVGDNLDLSKLSWTKNKRKSWCGDPKVEKRQFFCKVWIISASVILSRNFLFVIISNFQEISSLTFLQPASLTQEYTR